MQNWNANSLIKLTFLQKKINLLNRNKGRKNRISELVANDSTYRTPKETTRVWSDYFQDLYTPKANDNFDDDHKCFVEQSIATMLTASHTNYKHTIDDDITYDEVCFAIILLKRNKACGFDSIANGHLKRIRNETYSPKLDVGICIPYTY